MGQGDAGQRMKHHHLISMTLGRLRDSMNMLDDLILDVELGDTRPMSAGGGTETAGKDPPPSLSEFLSTANSRLASAVDDLNDKIAKLRGLLF